MALRWKFVLAVLTAVSGGAVAAYFLLSRAGERWYMAWAFAILALVAVVLPLAYRRYVSQPLRRILEGAQRLSEGDHAHRIELRGHDDLAAVADSLNHMAVRVARAQERLGDEVDKRTRDLRSAVKEAKRRSAVAEEARAHLEEANRRKGEFLTNVSHELRTPLNSIIGFVRLLLDGMFENEAERREFLEGARESANHLKQLVEDVLSAARIEAGQIEVNVVAMAPGDVIFHTVRVIEAQVREKGVDLRLEVDGELMVVADEPKLRQILLNLLANAIKFTDAGSVTLRARSAGSFVRFEVADTGMGIPASEQERIFEKFHQVDSPTVRCHGGTGLGLAISRDLVHLMGGEIGVESDGPGEGACFWFTLPALAPELKRAVEAAAAESLPVE